VVRSVQLHSNQLISALSGVQETGVSFNSTSSQAASWQLPAGRTKNARKCCKDEGYIPGPLEAHSNEDQGACPSPSVADATCMMRGSASVYSGIER
jgi:hypothetical protein